MRFTRIKFNGLYNLEDVDLDLSSGSALIVGPSGSGKTNIIKVIQWILGNYAKAVGGIYGDEPLSPALPEEAVNDEAPEKYVEIHAGLSETEMRIACKFRAIFLAITAAKFVVCIKRLASHYSEKTSGFSNEKKKYIPVSFQQKVIIIKRCAAKLYPELLAIAEDSCNKNPTYGMSDAVMRAQYSRTEKCWDTPSFLVTETLKLPIDSALKEVTTIRSFIQSFVDDEFAESEKLLTFAFPHSYGDGDSRTRVYVNEEGDEPTALSRIITSWVHPRTLACRLDPHTIFLKVEEKTADIIFEAQVQHTPVRFHHDDDVGLSIAIRKNVDFFISIKEVMGTLLGRNSDVERAISMVQSNPASLLTTYLSSCLQKSLCILPQDRGLSEGENVPWAISLKSVEQQLIKWKLSKNITWRSRCVKVQKALKSMTGLEVDVLLDDDSQKEQNTQEDGKQLMDKKNPPLRLLLRKNRESDGFLVSDLSGGERECLMVLTATQWENADTVFLDEPGHSLHPPQQAQLRRWLETQRRPGQVIAIISHAVEFISPVSLRSLYHMSDTGKGFTPFRLAISDDSLSEVATDALGEVEPMPAAGPSSQDVKVSSEAQESNRVHLSQKTVTMLMNPDMRKMFFTTGVYFVEGETDKRFLSALRYYMLEQARRIRERSENSRDLLQAQMILEMDSWDILVLGGCANALKAHQAAKELKIPCAVVLDEDTITVKHGKRTESFTQANWEKSRLYRELKKNEKSVNAATTILEEMRSAFNQSASSTVGQKAREILKKRGFWVWHGDLEHIVFDNQGVRQGIQKTDVIVEYLAEELSCKLTIGERIKRSSDDSVKHFDDNIRDPLTLKLEELQNELEASREAKLQDSASQVTKGLQRSLNEISRYQQKVKQHDEYCQGERKRSPESGEPMEEVPRVSQEEETESDYRAQEEAFWKRVKEKLHDDGGWMMMPWEMMQQIIALCLKDENGHLAEFCRFMKCHQNQGKPEKKFEDVPEDIISKILAKTVNLTEDKPSKATQCSPDDIETENKKDLDP